jgi:hypothetical protein
MKKLIVSILFLSLIVFCPACKKGTDEFIVTGTTTINFKDSVWENESSLNAAAVPVPTLNIEKLTTELSKIAENKSFEAELGGKIITTDNVSLDIPANACVSKDNKPCKGKIDIEILYLRTKGDLIMNDKPTTSGGKLLVSGGVVYITATQNKQEVKIANGKTLKIRLKINDNAIADANMRFFEGKTDGRFKFDWVQISGQNGPTVTPAVWVDSVNSRENKGYEILTDRFGWINCDKFHDDQNLTNKFSVTLADNFTNRNTSVFVVFKDINSVVKLEGSPSTKQFTIPNGYKGIPIGKAVTVVSISKFDDKSTMFDTQDATVSATAIIKMKPVTVSADEMKKRIQSL